MNPQQFRQAFHFAIGTILFAAVTNPRASAESVKIAVPNAFADVEGDVSVLSSGSFWFQQLFLASEFAELPETHRTLIGIYHRPDKSVAGQPGPVTYNDLRTQLSTTTKGPNDLTVELASNRGNDVTTVFDGSVTISTNNVGPDIGPRDFDYYFPWTTPFTYDPSAGNLLLEAFSSSGAIGGVTYDGFTSSSPRVVNGRTGSVVNGGFVLQFEFVPSADFNFDSDVDSDDLLIWQSSFGVDADGDANGDSDSDGDDFLIWQSQFGLGSRAASIVVPEPASWLLLLTGLATTLIFPRRRQIS